VVAGWMMRNSSGIVIVSERVSAVYLCNAAVPLSCLLCCSGARVVLLSCRRARHWVVVCERRSVFLVVRHCNRLLRRVVAWVIYLVWYPCCCRVLSVFGRE
jgi:hypothetical protein